LLIRRNPRPVLNVLPYSPCHEKPPRNHLRNSRADHRAHRPPDGRGGSHDPGPVAQQAGSKFTDLKDRLEEAKDKLTEVYGRARRGVVAGAKYADNTIRENPYISIGAALGVGVVIGMLIKRSSR
jgi:hypothetical protein